MSSIRIPPFDLLSGDRKQFGGFGDVLPPSQDRAEALLWAAAEARGRISEVFKVDLDLLTNLPLQLDGIIDDMWAQHWNPELSDLNLFTRDFGLVLTEASPFLLGGALSFRSQTDITHVSIWWSKKRLEAFPFHKIIKRLHSREGESVVTFIKGLSQAVLG